MTLNKTYLAVLMLIYVLATVATMLSLTLTNYNRNETTEWILAGGVQSTSVQFRIRASDDGDGSDGTFHRVFVLSSNEAISDESFWIFYEILIFDPSVDHGIQSLSVTFLDPNTRYFYGSLDEGGNVLRSGSIRTPVPEGSRMNFTIAAAGCAWTGSKNAIFENIADLDPLMILHAGDLHYEDINVDDASVRINAIDKVMGSSPQRKMFSGSSLAYMWDDHDWLGNNMGAEGKGSEAALHSYQLAFPHYPLQGLKQNYTNTSITNVAPYQSFTIGTVRFIITDLRSESTQYSIYSDEQRDWLYQEIKNSSAYDFVVWLSTKPWIGNVDESKDTWYAFPKDRENVSEWISETVGKENQNIIMISSDAHMVAFDDGTNSFYGTVENQSDEQSNYTNKQSVGIGFPVLQTGPFHRMGSVKGGPFSGGCYTYTMETNSQFSTIEFEMPSEADTTTTQQEPPCLIIKSYRSKGRGNLSEIFQKRLCGKIMKTNDGGEPVGSCEASTLSTPSMSLLISSIVLLFIFSIGCFCSFPISEGLKIFVIILLTFVLIPMIGFLIPYLMEINQFEPLSVLVILSLAMLSACIYLGVWVKQEKNEQ